MLFLGIDLGTQGARALVSDPEGNVKAKISVPLYAQSSKRPQGWHEQDPDAWWEAVTLCMRKLISTSGLPAKEITAISVDSTSGTVLPVDKNGKALYPAIMYNDSRSADHTDLINQHAGTFLDNMAYRFNASFALSKIVWLKDKQPDIYKKAWKFLHAADFIVGKLTGDFSTTDTSNVLKCGYDITKLRWPGFISNELGIDREKLPDVYLTGKPVGNISDKTRKKFNLSPQTTVVAGATDGMAAFFASGALAPGDWNSCLGTTLVVRGVSKKLLKDPEGRIYSHFHPEGYWLPGGASNVGGECLMARFPNANLKELDKIAQSTPPTELYIYPLVRKGERLPFLNPEAKGFTVGSTKESSKYYKAHLEGVAYVEKWIYDLCDELGGGEASRLFATGGAAVSREWLQIRSNILNKEISVPGVTDAAFGSAMIAGTGGYYKNMSEAGKNMIKTAYTVFPQSEYIDLYREKYEKFRKLCHENLGI